MDIDELFERHGDAIAAYVRRRLSNRADADEVIADVFVRAWRSAGARPSTPEREQAWLYTIARHAVIDRYRRRATQQRLRDRLRQRLVADIEPPTELEDDVLARALTALSAADRELLRLVAWEELSHAVIAEILGCREQNVAVRLHRARARLRRHLSDATPGHQRRVHPASERSP